MEQRRFTPAEDLAYQIQAKLDYLSELKLTLEVRLRDVTKGALVFGLVGGFLNSFLCVLQLPEGLCFALMLANSFAGVKVSQGGKWLAGGGEQ